MLGLACSAETTCVGRPLPIWVSCALIIDTLHLGHWAVSSAVNPASSVVRVFSSGTVTIAMLALAPEAWMIQSAAILPSVLRKLVPSETPARPPPDRGVG